MKEIMGYLTQLEPLLNAAWVLVVASITSIFNYWLRPRFTGLGARHRTEDGSSYRFAIHYVDNVVLDEPVKLEARILGAGDFDGSPTLLAGPGEESRPMVRVKKEEEKTCTFELRGARPRSTWILQFETKGDETNARVSITSPRMVPILAHSLQPQQKSVEKEASSHDLGWLLATLLAATVAYMVMAAKPEIVLGARMAEKLSLDRPPPSEWDLVPAAAAFVAILAMYYVCLPRTKLPLCQGYLGWERDEVGGERSHSKEAGAEHG